MSWWAGPHGAQLDEAPESALGDLWHGEISRLQTPTGFPAPYLERRSALSHQKQTHRRQADVAMLGVCQPYARQMLLIVPFQLLRQDFCTRCACEVSRLYLRSTFAGIFLGFKEIVVSHEGACLMDEALAASSKLFGMTR